MNGTITRAAEGDYGRLLEIWASSVKATHGFLTDEDFEFYKAKLPSYFGAVELHLHKDARGETDGFLGVTGSGIEMLFVSAEARGNGAGKALLLFAVESLNADSVDVNEENAAALGFYERFGFTIIGRSPTDSEGKNHPILHLRRDGKLPNYASPPIVRKNP